MAVRGHPVFAALYDFMSRGFERQYMINWRREVLAGCHGRVLDVGVGTGANFTVWKELLDAGTPLELHAVEPDPHMLRRARRKADALDLPVRLHQAPAEALPYPDGHFDFVVVTLVLCTVDNPGVSLQEMSRVLRPGGELRFLEHVRTEDHRAAWQDRIRPLFALLAGGCQINRRTGELLQAHFGEVTWRPLDLPPPTWKALLGRAVKPGAT